MWELKRFKYIEDEDDGFVFAIPTMRYNRKICWQEIPDKKTENNPGKRPQLKKIPENESRADNLISDGGWCPHSPDYNERPSPPAGRPRGGCNNISYSHPGNLPRRDPIGRRAGPRRGWVHSQYFVAKNSASLDWKTPPNVQNHMLLFFRPL
jgi:hypothetical protein